VAEVRNFRSSLTDTTLPIVPRRDRAAAAEAADTGLAAMGAADRGSAAKGAADSGAAATGLAATGEAAK
jgi:hypothetical protein